MRTPKFFGDLPNEKICFRENDFRNNQVELYTKERRATAYYRIGHDLTLGLPSNYTHYTLEFVTYATVTAADLDYISTWTQAKHLEISDGCNAALGLLRRAHKLQAMTKLTSLDLNISENSLQRMRLRPFFRSLQSLKTAVFRFQPSLSVSQVKAFLDEQVIPSKFKRSEIDSNLAVVYSINPEEDGNISV